jgi:hypothetical protein
LLSPTQAVALGQSINLLALPVVGLGAGGINAVVDPVLNANALSTNAANKAVGAISNANFAFEGAGNGFQSNPFAPFQTPPTGVAGNFIGAVPSATGSNDFAADFAAATLDAGSVLGAVSFAP